jgi:hypothetical protein
MVPAPYTCLPQPGIRHTLAFEGPRRFRGCAGIVGGAMELFIMPGAVAPFLGGPPPLKLTGGIVGEAIKLFV